MNQSSGPITVRELRETYIRFFESKGHLAVPSGSLIPFDVTGKLDESLLFNGAGMIQFKPYFRGMAKPQNLRLTTAQKCLRTGDIDDVGDDSHLTFFEMMGNFSFGDYFKKEAINYSWEFLTDPRWLNLDKNRLAFTVFEEDSDSETFWSELLKESGIDPEGRIFRLGEETNYWPAGSFSNGPPGPCGPNSEIFYWTPPDESPPAASTYSSDDFGADELMGRWVEIWNDVFIAYDWQGVEKEPGRPSVGWEKTGLLNLPFRSIDTGMGLERTAAVLEGKESPYETDAFLPIILVLSGLTSKTYESEKRAYRIICDHIRSACFCVADGILLSNTGRGYVLRRLIRRAILQGARSLEIQEPFLYKLVAPVVAIMGSHYTELVSSRLATEEMLRNEEILFRRTLELGMERLQKILSEGAAGSNLVSGEDAFKLHDTYGFPLEITLEIAAENGWKVDEATYETLMEDAQDRSRAGQSRDLVYGSEVGGIQQDLPPTVFLGYEVLEAETNVLSIQEVDEKTLSIVLAETPFYAASGGQVTDHGELRIGAESFPVLSVSKKNGVIFHQVGWSAQLVGEVQATGVVDKTFRAPVRRNHTATHILHAALHTFIGPHASQAGSYVGADGLRFDFSHSKALTSEEIKKIEDYVNDKILENSIVKTYVDLPLAEAKAMGAMALFGEKYGEKVRLVEIDSFSRELCGGTHVSSTGEIGFFKILSEHSASSGVRRIEAITGEEAIKWIYSQEKIVIDSAKILKANPSELPAAIEKLQATGRDQKNQIEKLRTQTSGVQVQSKEIGSIVFGSTTLKDATKEDASLLADQWVSENPKRAILVATSSSSDANFIFVVKAGDQAVGLGVHAGNLVKEIAKITGGGGGGGASFASGKGQDLSKLPVAINAVENFVNREGSKS